MACRSAGPGAECIGAGHAGSLGRACRDLEQGMQGQGIQGLEAGLNLPVSKVHAACPVSCSCGPFKIPSMLQDLALQGVQL